MAIVTLLTLLEIVACQNLTTEMPKMQLTDESFTSFDSETNEVLYEVTFDDFHPGELSGVYTLCTEAKDVICKYFIGGSADIIWQEPNACGVVVGYAPSFIGVSTPIVIINNILGGRVHYPEDAVKVKSDLDYSLNSRRPKFPWLILA
ncbi:MAG: hypothetical protein NTV42_10325 [Chloroflexi bacterium]|nr:hypothetical protein [Chloroflexota bacterium]